MRTKTFGLVAMALAAAALFAPIQARAYVIFDSTALLQAQFLSPKLEKAKAIGTFDKNSGFVPPKDIGATLTVIGSSDGTTFATKTSEDLAKLIIALAKDNKSLSTIEIVATNVHENHDNVGLAEFKKDLVSGLTSFAPKLKLTVKGFSTNGQKAWSALFINATSFCQVTAADRVALTGLFDRFRARDPLGRTADPNVRGPASFNQWCQADINQTPEGRQGIGRVSGELSTLSAHLSPVR